MEPIHLRSSVAQSQEVARLQRAAEHLDDHGRQALVRELQEDQRLEKVDASEKVQDARVGPDQDPQKDTGEKSRGHKKGQPETAHGQSEESAAAVNASDGLKGRFLDIFI